MAESKPKVESKAVPAVECKVQMDFTWAGKLYAAGQTVKLGPRQAKRLARQSIVELPKA